MQITHAFGYLIYTVSLINLIRIGVFSILSDYYDVSQHRRKPNNFKPFVSIIVPAHNERVVIGRCLKSIYSTDYNRFEVIVVDDGSTDTTTSYAKYLRRKYKYKNLRLVRKRQNGGKASAINYGVKYAKGSVIVIMDADCTLDDQAIRRGASYFKNRSVNAVASNIKVMKSSSLLLVTQLLEYGLAYRLKKAHSVLNIEYLAGCTSFFRKSAIKQAGYFDEDTIAEDFDFSLKLIRHKGHSIVYAEDVICYTEGVATLKDLFRQRYRWRFGSFQAFFKNRQIFYSRTESTNKFLTWVLLPWLLMCEFIFILEPLLLAWFIYITLHYQYTASFLYGFAFYGALVTIAVLADENSSVNHRLKLSLFVPIAYPLFMVINYIGYISLIKSIVNSRNIFNLNLGSVNGWISPTRNGL